MDLISVLYLPYQPIRTEAKYVEKEKSNAN
jgi:hypothetical protein